MYFYLLIWLMLLSKVTYFINYLRGQSPLEQCRASVVLTAIMMAAGN